MADTAEAAGARPFDRITFDAEVMGGRACIRGMRVAVATIVDQIADGASIEDVLAEYPYLEREDVRQAIAYAAWLARDEVIPAQGYGLRLLLDANLSPRLAEWLRDSGYGALHVSELGLATARDRDIFEQAASEGRTVLTSDLDFGDILERGGGGGSVVIMRLRSTLMARVTTRLDRVLPRVVSVL